MNTICRVCGENSGIILNCSHGYCSSCLVNLCKEQISEHCYEPIKCQFCHEIIEISYVFEVFGGKNKYSVFHNTQELFNCELCMTDKKIMNSCSFECGHFFCKECIFVYFDYKIDSTEFGPQGITCPECSEVIPLDVIKGIVGETIIAQYSYLLKVKNKPLDKGKRIMRWCLVCQNCCTLSEFEREMICYTCNQRYCSRCKKETHEQMDCDYFEIDQDQEKQRKVEGSKDFIRFLEDQNRGFICPNCNESVAIEKGCNFILCPWPGCKNTCFCTLCGKILTVKSI